MYLNGLISSFTGSRPFRSASRRAFINSLSNVSASAEPISVNGYLRKAETDDFVLFSESLQATSWIRISVRKIHELDYLGRELAPHGVCAKVRLTI
jgi:hypothetical protein